MDAQTKKHKRPGRPAPGHTLTPAAVAEAAARLIDADGVNEFSMRCLGQTLGVEAMALYNHFADKDAILDAVASVALSAIPVPAPRGSWRQRIKAIANGVRDMARQRPNLFRMAMTRRLIPTAGIPLAEAVLAALADAGLDPEDQAVGYRVCFLYVRGFCLWELEEFGPTCAGSLPQLPPIPPEFPNMAAASRWVLTPDCDAQFEAGLETILRGVSARNGRRG